MGTLPFSRTGPRIRAESFREIVLTPSVFVTAFATPMKPGRTQDLNHRYGFKLFIARGMYVAGSVRVQ